MANPFDQFDPPPLAAAPPAAPGAGPPKLGGAANPFDQFDEPDPGYLGEIGRGLKAGATVQLPKMAGEAAKFFGADTLGEKLIDISKKNDTPDVQESAVGQAHDSPLSVRGNVYEAATNAVPSMAPGAAGAVIGAGVGSVVPGVGTGVGALAGYALGSIAALPMFYGSQGQESYEAVKKRQLELGKPDAEADSIARKTAHTEGAIEAGGELVSDVLPFGKLLQPFVKPAAKAAGTLVKSALLPTVKEGLKTVGKVVGGEVATEMGQQAGEDYARKAIGDEGPGATWEETAKVIMPTALMSVLPGAGGAAASHIQRANAAKALADPATAGEERAKIALGLASAIEPTDPGVSRAFAQYAIKQIQAGAPIEIGDDSLYLNAAKPAPGPISRAANIAKGIGVPPRDDVQPSDAMPAGATQGPAPGAEQPIGAPLTAPEPGGDPYPLTDAKGNRYRPYAPGGILKGDEAVDPLYENRVYPLKQPAAPAPVAVAEPAATAEPAAPKWMPLSAEGAQAQQRLRGGRIVPNPARPGTHAVIEDMVDTATTDEGRILGMIKEGRQIIARLPAGKPPTSQVLEHLRMLDTEISALRKDRADKKKKGAEIEQAHEGQLLAEATQRLQKMEDEKKAFGVAGQIARAQGGGTVATAARTAAGAQTPAAPATGRQIAPIPTPIPDAPWAEQQQRPAEGAAPKPGPTEPGPPSDEGPGEPPGPTAPIAPTAPAGELPTETPPAVTAVPEAPATPATAAPDTTTAAPPAEEPTPAPKTETPAAPEKSAAYRAGREAAEKGKKRTPPRGTSLGAKNDWATGYDDVQRERLGISEPKAEPKAEPKVEAKKKKPKTKKQPNPLDITVGALMRKGYVADSQGNVFHKEDARLTLREFQERAARSTEAAKAARPARDAELAEQRAQAAVEPAPEVKPEEQKPAKKQRAKKKAKVEPEALPEALPEATLADLKETLVRIAYIDVVVDEGTMRGKRISLSDRREFKKEKALLEKKIESVLAMYGQKGEALDHIREEATAEGKADFNADQAAAQTRPRRPRKKYVVSPDERLRRDKIRNDPLIKWILKQGGINATAALDTIGEKAFVANKIVMGLFRKMKRTAGGTIIQGHGLDDLATQAGHEGFLSPKDLEDVDGGKQALIDLIAGIFAGKRKGLRAQDEEAEFQRLHEEHQRMQELADAARLNVVDVETAGVPALAPDLQAPTVEVIAALSEVTENRPIMTVDEINTRLEEEGSAQEAEGLAPGGEDSGLEGGETDTGAQGEGEAPPLDWLAAQQTPPEGGVSASDVAGAESIVPQIEKAIDTALTTAEKETAADELGHDEWGPPARNTFLSRYAEWLHQGAKDVASTLGKLFHKVLVAFRQGLLSLAIAFNFNVAQVAKPLVLPKSQTVIKTVIEKPKANFNGYEASAEAHIVADWYVRNNRNEGKPFMLADKAGGLLYAFDESGLLIAKAPALYGEARGDELTEAQQAKTIAQSSKADKITPAGEFDAQGYEKGVSVAQFEKSSIAIHSVYLGTPSEKRGERLASATGADNRVSYGCINVTEPFMAEIVRPYFGGDSKVVVLPENLDAATYFKIDDDKVIEQLQTIDTSPTSGAGSLAWGTDRLEGVDPRGRTTKFSLAAKRRGPLDPLFNALSQTKEMRALSPAQRGAVLDAIEKRSDAQRVIQQLRVHEGTPWAKQAIDGVLIRAALDELLAGKTPAFESMLDDPGASNTREAAKAGAEVLWARVHHLGLIGEASKPLNNVNSSFINCTPSRDCANYCYAAGGRYPTLNPMIKSELTNWAIENNPVRAATLIANEYKTMAEFYTNKALRLFDKGDGDAAWIPMIKELNKQGVRVQVFSKNPEFLRDVPAMNVRLLSADKSNQNLVRNNPDLPVAFVYSDESQIKFLDEIKDRVQVILPVRQGLGLIEQEQRDALPLWSRRYVCPIDNGTREVGKQKSEWNCTRCDYKAGLGCFYGQVTERVMKAFSSPVGYTAIQKQIEEIQNEARHLPPGERGKLLESLDSLVSAIRAGIDVATEGQSPSVNVVTFVRNDRGLGPDGAPGATEGVDKPTTKFSLAATSTPAVQFLSGMSRRRDFLEAAGRERPVGVVAGELSQEDVKQLARSILDHHAQVFVDSGAYGLFNRRKKALEAGRKPDMFGSWKEKELQDLNFDKIIAKYDQLLREISDQNAVEEDIAPVYLVMPDIVGNQDASLQLVKRYAKDIKLYSNSKSVKPIVPLQRGKLSLVEAYDQVVDTLGTDNFVVGIPSVVEAASHDEVEQLMRERKPAEVHILGAGAEETLGPRLEAIDKSGHKPTITSDANSVRTAMTQMSRDDATRLVLGVEPGAPVRQATGIHRDEDIVPYQQAEDEAREFGHYDLRNIEPVDPANIPDPTTKAPIHADPQNTLVLMACSDTKGTHPAELFNLYQGPMWQTLRTHLGEIPKQNVIVLSAKHGWASSALHVEPYNERMTRERSDELVRQGIVDSGLAKLVAAVFEGRGPITNVIMAGGEDYRRAMMAAVHQMDQALMTDKNAAIVAPQGGIGLQRMGLGKTLRAVNTAPVTAGEEQRTLFSQARKTASQFQRELEARHPRMHINLYEFDNGYVDVAMFELVDRINDEGEGYARAAMQDLTAWLDREGRTAGLLAAPLPHRGDGLLAPEELQRVHAERLEVLRRFYERNGFKLDAGQEFSNAYTMTRYAQPQESQGTYRSVGTTSRRLAGADAVGRGEEARAGRSPEALRAAITRRLGRVPHDVEIVRDWTDLPDELAAEVAAKQGYNTEGIYHPPTNKTYLIASNIEPEDGLSVYLHEVGVHKGLRDFIGTRSFNQLAAQIEDWALGYTLSGENTEEARIAKRAMDRIPGGLSEADRAEELIAYFVTEAVRAGHDPGHASNIGAWLRKLFDSIVAAIKRLTGSAREITAREIVGLARGAAEHASMAREGEAAYSAPTHPLQFGDAKQSDLYKPRTAAEVGFVPDAQALAQAKQNGIARRIMEGKGATPPKVGARVGVRLALGVQISTKAVVQTIHQGTQAGDYMTGKGWAAKPVLGYANSVTLKNAYFAVDQEAREDIAGGLKKSPMASVDGEYLRQTEPNFDGIMVGFNPHREHLFVDSSGYAVRSAEEVTIYGHKAYLRGKVEYFGKVTTPARAGDKPSKVVPTTKFSEPFEPDKTHPLQFGDATESPLYHKRTAAMVGLVDDSTKIANVLATDKIGIRVMKRAWRPEPDQVIGARINLNLLRHGILIQSIHAGDVQERYKKGVGLYSKPPMSYMKTVTMRDAYFNVSQSGREAIVSTDRGKHHMASVDGKFVRESDPNFDGIEISFNPHRGHLFVDKNGYAIRSAEEVTVYGHRAYARGRIEYYGKATTPARAGVTPSNVVPTTKFSLAANDLPTRAAAGVRDHVAAALESFGTGNRLGEDEGVLNSWNKTVGTPELVARKNPAFRKVFWEGQAYLGDINTYISESEKQLPSWFKGQGVLARWWDRVRGKEVAEAAKATKALLDGTLADRVYSDDELKERGLTPKEIDMYHDARMAINDMLERTGLALIQREAAEWAPLFRRMIPVYRDGGLQALEEASGYSEALGRARVAKTIKDIRESPFNKAWRERLRVRLGVEKKKLNEWKLVTSSVGRIDKLQKEGYFPLSRYGRHYVSVTDPRGEPVEFRMYEHEHLARVGSAQLAKRYHMYDVKRGTLSQNTNDLFKGLTPESVELFAKILGKDQDEAMQAWLKEAVANRSFLKRMIHRKGTEGYSDDAVRVLADFISLNARYVSRLAHATNLLDYARDIQGGELRDYAIKMVQYLGGADGREEYHGLRSFMFFQYIGGNISSALLNLTQVPMFTLPWLTKHTSILGAGAALTRAYRMAASTSDDQIPGELGVAMKRAAADGLTDPANVYATMAIGSGSKLSRSRALTGLLDAWSSLFAKAETFNRRVTFIAAYETAKTIGKSDDEAYELAKEAVNDTQLIYNKGNRPVWARGIGALPFTFKLFTIGMLETIVSRMKPQQAAMVLALLLAGAGFEGLPFAEDLEDIIDTVAQKLGYAVNSKQAMKEGLEYGLREFLGLPLDTAHYVAEMMRRGVFANTMLSTLGARVGMGNIIPGTSAFLTGRDVSKEVAEAGGPAVALIQNVATAGELLARGEYERAAEKVLPTGAANVMKGVRQLEEGKEQTAFGRNVAMDIPAEQAYGQMVGVSGQKVAHAREQQDIVQQNEQYLKVVKDRIADKWAQALIDKDPAAQAEARAELAAHNERNPDQKIRITPLQIQLRARNLRLTPEQAILRNVPVERRRDVSEFLAKP